MQNLPMQSANSLTFLGSSGSMGIPVIGCQCAVCLSTDLYNNRMRPSVLLKIRDKTILIDCGPDFRFQALRVGLTQLDGLILTHGHNDHMAGLDDLRALHLQSHQPLPCLLSQETATDISQRFNYFFASQPAHEKKLVVKFLLQIFPKERGLIDFLGLPVHYFSYEQAKMQVNGLRFGNLAYVTDIRHYPATIYEDLKGAKTLILSALRFEPSPLHFHIDEAIDFANRVGAEQTWLTHIAHELDHVQANAYLPKNIRLAYDGLQLNFQFP